MRPIAVLIVALAVCGGAMATMATMATMARAESATPSIQALDWMAGCWRLERDGTVMEECWMAPAGDMMLATHRDRFASGRTFFEFLRIEAVDETLTYFASPMGRAPTPFPLIESSGGRVVFENPQHDYPQRILYWIDADGRLHARIEGTEEGRDRATEWVYERAGG